VKFPDPLFLADDAAESGISIFCIEMHGGLSSTGTKTAELVRAIDKPNVNYDTANVIFLTVAPEEDIKAAAVREPPAPEGQGWRRYRGNFSPDRHRNIDFVPSSRRWRTWDSPGRYRLSWNSRANRGRPR